MSGPTPEVDTILEKAERWQDEMRMLRAIVLGCGLTEAVKWRQPCYTFENHNVAIISAFKDYCSLAFFKGALLKDPEGVLVAPGKHAQSGRQMRFTSVEEIVALEATAKTYLREAIEVERAGLTVRLRETSEYEVPEELQRRLDDDPAYRTAFEALTPGRQRGYLVYFAQPKQSKTRESRIERALPRILEGKGFNER